jgi:hypothetical protein
MDKKELFEKICKWTILICSILCVMIIVVAIIRGEIEIM